MQHHAELEDRDADDLRRDRVADERGLRVVVEGLLSVDRLIRVVVRGVRFGPVRRVLRGQAVAVRVVRETESLEACSPPAEGDDLHDEDEEDAEETDAECVGLGECCLTSASAHG